MKKIVPAGMLVMIALLCSTAFAGSIIDSPHYFSEYPTPLSASICTPCHAPHTARNLPTPLWERESYLETYPTYGRKGFEGLTAVGSRICLSCHDGIIALDRYSRNPEGASAIEGRDTGFMPGGNHPVSFVYDAVLAFRENKLWDPSTRRSGLPGSNGTIAMDMLFANRMECASCHDVHNTKSVPGTKLLVKTTAGSALCLTCHNI